MPVTVLAHVGVASVELWAGAVHPWLNLESGLALAAGTLWLTQRARASDVQPFVVSAVALALGVAWGCGGVAPLPSAMGLLIALAVGAAVMLDVVPSLRVRGVVVGLGALVVGAIAGADAAVDVRTPVLFVAGALSGGLVFPLFVAVLLAGRRVRAVGWGLRFAGAGLAVASVSVWSGVLRG